MANIIRVLGTEDDKNQIWNPIRVQFMIGCVVALLAMFGFIILAFWTVIHGKAGLDYMAFGGGFAALLAGFGSYVGGTGAALFMEAKAP